MKLTFADQGMLYIVEGYGEQATSGYSIEVADCFETENASVPPHRKRLLLSAKYSILIC